MAARHTRRARSDFEKVLCEKRGVPSFDGRARDAGHHRLPPGGHRGSRSGARGERRCSRIVERRTARVMELERLQKIIAHAGFASRREAETMIREGRVTVNGTVVTELGSRADAGRDHIKVDGK